MNLNIGGDFQFCISVPLTQYKKIIETCTDRIEGVDKICWSAGMKFQPFKPEFHLTIVWQKKIYHTLFTRALFHLLFVQIFIYFLSIFLCKHELNNFFIPLNGKILSRQSGIHSSKSIFIPPFSNNPPFFDLPPSFKKMRQQGEKSGRVVKWEGGRFLV